MCVDRFIVNCAYWSLLLREGIPDIVFIRVSLQVKEELKSRFFMSRVCFLRGFRINS